MRKFFMAMILVAVTGCDNCVSVDKIEDKSTLYKSAFLYMGCQKHNIDGVDCVVCLANKENASVSVSCDWNTKVSE